VIFLPPFALSLSVIKSRLCCWKRLDQIQTLSKAGHLGVFGLRFRQDRRSWENRIVCRPAVGTPQPRQVCRTSRMLCKLAAVVLTSLVAYLVIILADIMDETDAEDETLPFCIWLLPFQKIFFIGSYILYIYIYIYVFIITASNSSGCGSIV
jgi:hypothetical protein